MAKKGQAVQLQTDVNSDDEWEKLLDKVGLIIVDVYSEWCGPCSAMAAILKKLKLEIGGDLLHLATAKCDNIKVLSRFRDKSEPTWMFISDGKVVNMMFGANAPKLIATITSELKREKEARAGTITRSTAEPNEMSGEEKVRFDKEEAIKNVSKMAEEAAANEAMVLKRQNEVEIFLQVFNEIGIMLSWPHSKDKVIEVMQEPFQKYGLSVGSREKPLITSEDIELIEYFADGYHFPEEAVERLKGTKTFAWTIKGGEDPTNIDEVLKLAVYGESKCPPGDPGSPAQQLVIPPPEKDDADKEPTKADKSIEEMEEKMGLWCPPNSNTKTMAVKTIFKHLAAPHILPEPEPIPPHVAMIFDAFKRKEVLALTKEYPKEVMRYGFFTEENPETAKLIAKTAPKFEKTVTATTYGEKLVIQLSKKRSDPLLAFAQLGPSYMSTNSVEGDRECKLFFPEGYDIPEDEEVVEEVKKPKRKKKGAQKQAVAAAEDDGTGPPVEAGEGQEEHPEEGAEGGEGKDEEVAEEGLEGEEALVEGEGIEGEEAEGEIGLDLEEEDVFADADSISIGIEGMNQDIDKATETEATPVESPAAPAEVPDAPQEVPSVAAEVPVTAEEVPEAAAEVPSE